MPFLRQRLKDFLDLRSVLDDKAPAGKVEGILEYAILRAVDFRVFRKQRKHS